jgi:glycosyltransferase involved in cell wall biosynthesis
VDLIWSFSFRRKLAKVIKEFKPDIVHFHKIYPLPSFGVFHLIKEFGCATVFTLHDYRFLCIEGGFARGTQPCFKCLNGSPFSGVIYRCVQGSILKSLIMYGVNQFLVKSGIGLNWIDQYIAVSPFVKNIHSSLNIDLDHIKVVGNPVVTRTYVNNYPKMNIVFLGRLSKEKGFDLFLKLPSFLDQFRFSVVGGGGNLESQMETLDSAVDWKENLSSSESLDFLQNQASLVVVPSVAAESFCLVAYEAMGMGIPIVSSSNGNLSNLVDDSGGGVVVFKHSAHDYVKAILSVYKNETIYETYSRSGHQYVTQHYNSEKIAEQHEIIYKQCLALSNKRVENY